jgi:hypothetical protein
MLTVELVRVEYRVEFPQYDLRPLWSCNEFADKRTPEGTSLERVSGRLFRPITISGVSAFVRGPGA